jgi:ABC-type polysaccharide/polyol phosphate transport system ATPase subunit
MSDEVLVKVDNVSKRFCRSLKRSLWYGLQDLGSEIGGRRHGGEIGLQQSSADVQLRPDEFWAVKDVSFELRRGECLGLIGRNGAGKTTLLRILNGLIKPDSGRIEMCGQIGALIALGAGFNPVLTGRENILINASVMGLSKQQTKDRIDEIIDFAEIGDFIDSPVQTYSSGMQVRLGFAAATSMEPDILILDEVLAVGDGNFVSKCYNKIDQLRKKAAVLFVSHHMPHVGRMCSHCLYLEKGHTKIVTDNINAVIRVYRESAFEDATSKSSAPVRQLALFNPIKRIDAKLHSIKVDSQENISITLFADSIAEVPGFYVTLDAKNEFNEFISSMKIHSSDYGIRLHCGESFFVLQVHSLPLRSGKYYLTLGMLNSDGSVLAIDRNFACIEIESKYSDTNSVSQFYGTIECKKPSVANPYTPTK